MDTRTGERDIKDTDRAMNDADIVNNDSSLSTQSSESDGPNLQRQGSRRSLILAASHRKRADSSEDNAMLNWVQQRKHFFILSNAGKPVWTRYGDESRISSLMGVIQAIISFFLDGNDTIKSIHAGDHHIVFLQKEPLYFVAVSKTGESESQLREQLGYLHNQILSVLTSAQLTRIFEQRVNFDLRRLLGGTEVFLESLSNLFGTDQSFTLGALQCLRMPRPIRDQIGSALSEGRVKNVLYAMIVAGGRLVTLLRPRRHSLHPTDLHLLFNMLTGSTTFHTAESWTPLCLSKFNSKIFLHVYICYIEQNISVVMISTDKNSFFEFSQWKCRIVETMNRQSLLDKIRTTENLYSVQDVGVAGLLHFTYKSKTQIQFTSPVFSGIYDEERHRQRLFHLYQHVYDRMHTRTRPLKLYFSHGEMEILLGWVTSSFELYVVFEESMSKAAIIAGSNHLLRWIKKNEDSLFIMNSPVF